MIEVAGGVPVPVPLSEEDDFSFDLQALDRLVSDRTRMIVLNSPSNPTGGVMSPSALEHIAALAMDRNIWVLSDEIYTRLVYESPAPSIAALPGMAERTIICDGFSKTYAMTGWRLGYGIMPPALAERVELLLTHSVGCTASFTQIAGLEAITGPQDQAERVVGRISTAAGCPGQRLERYPWGALPHTARGVLRLPKRGMHLGAARTGWLNTCWKRPGLPYCQGHPSVNTVRVISGCALPTPWKTSNVPWNR